jgi:hypothetical protein
MAKKWTNDRVVQIVEPIDELRGPRGSDQWLFWWMSLGLLINRHVPDCIPDEVVSQHLDHVFRTQEHLMPFNTPGE